MLHETEEFHAYTGAVDYFATGKYDSTYLGRFTYDMLLKFEGLSRVLKGFDREWRKKVLQFQISLFALTTKGAWIVRFDDILADALESGPLREQDASFYTKEMQRIEAVTPKGILIKVITTLISYYRANKPEDSDWVVLPVTNFDAYFGSTNFSRKWLSRIPLKIMKRQKQSFGVCRYMVGNFDIDK